MQGAPSFSVRDTGGTIQVEDRAITRPEHGGLIDGRKKAIGVHRLAGFDRAPRVGHHDVRRERPALRPEAVEDPRPDTRETGGHPAGEQFILRGGMDDHVGVARPNDGEVVDAFGRQGEEVGDVDTGLAILAKRPFGAQQTGVALDKLVLGFAELLGPNLAVELVEQRLGVEGLEMRRAPAMNRKMTDFALAGR